MTTTIRNGFHFLIGLMKTVTDLQSELTSLDEEYKKLHSRLAQAEADGSETEIIILLHKIHLVAKEQAEIKKKLDEIR